MNKRKDLWAKYPDLLSDLLVKFIDASKVALREGSYKPEVRAGDGDLPLSELAVRVFGAYDKSNDRWAPYFDWLGDAHPLLGTMTPIELLSSDPESWVVRDALLERWLEKNKLVVKRPDIPARFRMVSEGGFTYCVPA